MPRIAIIPGIMGTALHVGGPTHKVPFWLDIKRLGNWGLSPLRLNAAGDGQAPTRWGTTYEVQTAGILKSYYGRLYELFDKLGWEVAVCPYDWRKGIPETMASVLAKLTTIWPDGNVYIVAHSMGGLVARSLLNTLASIGKGGYVKRLVTLACPHWGTLAMCRLLARLDPTYKLLWKLMVPRAINFGIHPNDELDKTIASMQSIYSLMPSVTSPMWGGDVTTATAVLDPASYTRFNGWVLPQRFSTASGEKVALEEEVFPDVMVSYYGTDTDTAWGVSDTTKLDDSASYRYTDRGDGVVDVVSAHLPGVPQKGFPGVKHHEFPYAPEVLQGLPGVLLNGL